MTLLEVRKGSTHSITLNVLSFMQMEKIEESLFFYYVHKGTLEGYSRKWLPMGKKLEKSRCMTKMRGKFLFNSFIDFLHFEAGECVTYLKYNKKRKTEIDNQFYA